MFNEMPMPLSFLFCLAGLIAYYRMILDIYRDDSTFINKVTWLLITVPIFISTIIVTFAIFLKVLGFVIKLFI